MSISRRVARPMLSSVFIAGGLDSLRHPETKLKEAEAVTTPLSAKLPGPLSDPVNLVRLNGAVQVGAGVLLATGHVRRLAAVALMGSIIPTTAAGHRFWEEPDDQSRQEQLFHFLKNVGLLGGLILAAMDTEGAPSLGWRARRSVRSARGSVGHSVGHQGRRASRSAHHAGHQAEAVAAAVLAAASDQAHRVDIDAAQHHATEVGRQITGRGRDLAGRHSQDLAARGRVLAAHGPDLVDHGRDAARQAAAAAARGRDLADEGRRLAQHGAELAGPALQHGKILAGSTLEHGKALAGPAVQHGRDLAGPALEHGKALAGPAVQHGKALAGPAVQHGKALAGPAVQHGRDLAGPALEHAKALAGPALGQGIDAAHHGVGLVADHLGDLPLPRPRR